MPLDETIEICVNKLFKSNQTVPGLNKQQVSETLSSASKENVLVDQKYYTEIDGVVMGSSLGPVLTNIFLLYHKTTWLKNSSKSFKPVYNKKYVDDILVLFKKLEKLLTISTRDTKILNFCLKLKKMTPFLFSILRFVEKKVN